MAEIYLEDLADGEILEWLHRELAKAIKNIADEYTPADAIRKVIMEITIRPNADRTNADITADIYCKLPHENKVSTSIEIDQDDGWRILKRERVKVKDINMSMVKLEEQKADKEDKGDEEPKEDEKEGENDTGEYNEVDDDILRKREQIMSVIKVKKNVNISNTIEENDSDN